MPQSISSSHPSYSNAPDLSPDDYLVLGVATCFVKAEGEVHTVKLLEPVPSAYLEVLFKGVPTSYHGIYATQLSTVLSDNGELQLPEINLLKEHGPVRFCDDFVARAEAAARTYQLRTKLQQQLPIGSTYRDMNFSTEKKRVLNNVAMVDDADNVKQHAYTHQTL